MDGVKLFMGDELGNTGSLGDFFRELALRASFEEIEKSPPLDLWVCSMYFWRSKALFGLGLGFLAMLVGTY